MRKYKFFILWFVATMGTILFLYHRTMSLYLVADDYEWWDLVRRLNFSDTLRFFIPPDLGGIPLSVYYYRPFVGVILWFITHFFSMSQLIFNLTALFFHLINALLVGMVALYSFGKRKALFMASLFFSVFPFHAEAVNYIMYNTVMTTFYLLSFLSCIHYSKTRRVIWAYIACITFLLALMSFESAVTLIPGIFLFFLIYQRNTPKMIYRRYRYFLSILFLVFGFYFSWWSLSIHSVNLYSRTDYMNVLFTINNAFRLYLGVLIFLIFIRFCFRSIYNFFVADVRIFWFYTIFTGILFLPTFYMPTQERHLYLPSFACVLVLCSVIMTVDKNLFKANKFIKRVFWVGIVSMAVISGLFLMRQNERWVRSSNIAEKISQEIASVIERNNSEKKFYFINFPDSLDGVYIYRVRAREAIEFSLKKDITQELIFTPQIIGIKSDVSIISKRSILLKSDNGFMLFLPQKNKLGQYVMENREFTATQLDAKTLRIDFLNNDFDVRKSNVFVFRNESAHYKPFEQ